MSDYHDVLNALSLDVDDPGQLTRAAIEGALHALDDARLALLEVYAQMLSADEIRIARRTPSLSLVDMERHGLAKYAIARWDLTPIRPLSPP